MPEFTSPVDIGSIAAEACGQSRLDPVLGFSDPSSKAASEIGFVYGKARRAELRRNTWRCAVRRTTIRPVDTNTMSLAPTLWVQSAVYFAGSIVADQNGTLWESIIPNNTAIQPGTLQGLSVWQPYFGPLTAALYDSSAAYNSGEVVYTAAGNGTYNVWRSLTNGNAVHPALSNQWAATTVYFKNQVVQQFPAYASGTTYAAGAGVLYTDGNVYASLVGSNIGNTPPNSGTKWALLPVLTLQTQGVPLSGNNAITPLTSSPVLEWVQGQVYSLGNVVMFNGTEWLSIVNNNTGNFPNASGSTSWVAISGGVLSMSLIDLNLGNSPAASPSLWASTTTYASGNQVTGSDGVIYTSVTNGNVDHNPTLDTGTNWTNTGTLSPWTTVFTQGGGNDQWTQIGGASFPYGVSIAKLIVNWPVGSGYAWDTSTRNVLRLPAGFLRKASQDPKAGSVSWLGAPSNSVPDDWVFEGQYITTNYPNPITLRFVADVQDVTQLDDMFCIALGLAIAELVCESITNSTAKLGAIRARYKDKMGEASLVNAIEEEFDEPPLDDYIVCRL